MGWLRTVEGFNDKMRTAQAGRDKVARFFESMAVLQQIERWRRGTVEACSLAEDLAPSWRDRSPFFTRFGVCLYTAVVLSRLSGFARGRGGPEPSVLWRMFVGEGQRNRDEQVVLRVGSIAGFQELGVGGVGERKSLHTLGPSVKPQQDRLNKGHALVFFFFNLDMFSLCGAYHTRGMRVAALVGLSRFTAVRGES